ncbi:MAG TPA: NAD-dependent epimerase/dehydratase family protein [Candidatus Sulfotelmatobacter sp.]|nr:NAD-dependent epimerase/dehydratase family protein [Candidatus Sulfotelmatobacter sp.]
MAQAMRTLVTGGAGFIGSHLVDRLVGDGVPVTVLDDFSTGRRDNLEAAAGQGDVRVVEGSILDERAIAAAMAGVGRVYHLAVACVRASLGAPLDNHAVNATGTIELLEAARRAAVTRFVYCSSSEVYGTTSSEPLGELTAQCRPVTVYGAAKLAGELYTLAYFRTYGLPATVVRPFNAYGPREPDQGTRAEVIPRFTIRVLNGLAPMIFGDGSQGRDFTHVSDTVRGLTAAGQSDRLIGEIVNLGCGRLVTIADLARAVARACGRNDLSAEHLAPRPGDVHHLVADTTRARALLGFEARVGLEAGLADYVAWFKRRHPDPSRLLERDPVNWRLAEASR